MIYRCDGCGHEGDSPRSHCDVRCKKCGALMLRVPTDETAELADTIYQTLVNYCCMYTIIEDDGGRMPLVDLVSPSSAIESGEEELGELATEIAGAIKRFFCSNCRVHR